MSTNEESEETNDQELDKSPPLREKKKEKKKDGLEIPLPPCQHAWCFGEILRKFEVENGVCLPKPLPWGKPGRLKYLPGWAELCENYSVRPIKSYRVKKTKDPDRDRWEAEVREAKELISFLKPVLLFRNKTDYKDEEPMKICECKYKTCKMGELDKTEEKKRDKKEEKVEEEKKNEKKEDEKEEDKEDKKEETTEEKQDEPIQNEPSLDNQE